MSADKIEVGLIAQRISHVTGVLDFREKEAYAFVGWQLESMRKKILFNLLVREEDSLRIPCEHMDLIASVAKLMAEVISHPAGPADGVREEDICEHQNFHFGLFLSL
jgi:hypothetical protein